MGDTVQGAASSFLIKSETILEKIHEARVFLRSGVMSVRNTRARPMCSFWGRYRYWGVKKKVENILADIRKLFATILPFTH